MKLQQRRACADKPFLFYAEQQEQLTFGRNKLNLHQCLGVRQVKTRSRAVRELKKYFDACLPSNFRKKSRLYKICTQLENFDSNHRLYVYTRLIVGRHDAAQQINLVVDNVCKRLPRANASLQLQDFVTLVTDSTVETMPTTFVRSLDRLLQVACRKMKPNKVPTIYASTILHIVEKVLKKHFLTIVKTMGLYQSCMAMLCRHHLESYKIFEKIMSVAQNRIGRPFSMFELSWLKNDKELNNVNFPQLSDDMLNSVTDALHSFPNHNIKTLCKSIRMYRKEFCYYGWKVSDGKFCRIPQSKYQGQLCSTFVHGCNVIV